MGGIYLIFTPVLVRRASDPLGLSGPMTALLGLKTRYSKQSYIGRYNPHLAAYLPHHPLYPLPPTLLLMCTGYKYV